MSNNVGYIETLLRRTVATFMFCELILIMAILSILSYGYIILQILGIIKQTNLVIKQMIQIGKFMGHVGFEILSIESKMIAENLKQIQKTSPFILLFSHASFLDFFVCLKLADCIGNYKGIAKKEILKIPILGTVFKGLNLIGIDRKNREVAIKSINELAKKCKRENYNIVVAPEGTRRRKRSVEDCEDNFQPFKKGPFHLACDNNFPIRLLLIVGANRKWGYGQWFPHCGGTTLIKISEIIPKEVVATMDHNELRLYCRKKFVEFQSLKDYEIIRQKSPKKWFWFTIFAINMVINTFCSIKLYNHLF